MKRIGDTSRKLLPLLALLMVTGPDSRAQFSGWVSGAFGYSSNPLRTYEEVSDRVAQTFLQLGYGDPTEPSRLCFSYNGGLTLFDNTADRNYYEHSVQASYLLRFGIRQAVLRDSADESDGDSGSPGDSLRPYLLLAFKAGARHDRALFDDYDNQGAGLSLTGRTWANVPFHAQISNLTEYRNYSILHALSNLTNGTTLHLDFNPANEMPFGLLAGLTVKYYPVAMYDTSQFETQQTINGKSQGKGKGLGKGQSQKVKQLLINPQDRSATQFQAGLFAVSRWSSGSLSVEGVYRMNPGSPPRYLAQYANPPSIREDIYNDEMEYHGPEVNATLTQKLPLSLRSIIVCQIRGSNYGAPALDLNGVQIAAGRNDIRSSLEWTLSRYMETAGGIGFEVGLTTTILRNQSNDEYNDFSLVAFSLEIGLGF